MTNRKLLMIFVLAFLIGFFIRDIIFISDSEFYKQVFYNIFGGMIVALASIGWIYYKNHLMFNKFRAVFGNDVCIGDMFYLAYAELRPNIKNPYSFEKNGYKFSMSKAVGISEARAIGYLTKAIGINTKVSPIILSDFEINDKLDISFISFGLNSNNKTLDCLINKGNKKRYSNKIY